MKNNLTKSKCCKAEIMVINEDEGTMFWKCCECEKACDPFYGDVDENKFKTCCKKLFQLFPFWNELQTRYYAKEGIRKYEKTLRKLARE